MPQLDPVLKGLDADLKVAGNEEDEQALKKQIKARQDALLPVYLQVTHDRVLFAPYRWGDFALVFFFRCCHRLGTLEPWKNVIRVLEGCYQLATLTKES